MKTEKKKLYFSRKAPDSLKEFWEIKELVDCDIEFDADGDKIYLNGKSFKRCTLKFKKKAKLFSSSGAQFSECKFIGTFEESEFGEDFDEHKGVLKNCDFSQSTLLGCRFYNVDSKQIDFSQDEDLFVIENFAKDADAILESAQDGGLNRFAKFLRRQKRVTLFANTFSRASNMYGVTKDELEDFLSNFKRVK